MENQSDIYFIHKLYASALDAAHSYDETCECVGILFEDITDELMHRNGVYWGES